MSHSDVEKASAHDHEQVVIGDHLVLEKVKDINAVKGAKEVKAVSNGERFIQSSILLSFSSRYFNSCLCCRRQAIQPVPMV